MMFVRCIRIYMSFYLQKVERRADDLFWGFAQFCASMKLNKIYIKQNFNMNMVR